MLIFSHVLANITSLALDHNLLPSLEVKRKQQGILAKRTATLQTALKYVDLSWNKIALISPDFEQVFREVINLNLLNNNLSHFPPAVSFQSFKLITFEVMQTC
jgi:hypothetical protein